MNDVLVIVTAVLFGAGVYALLQRSVFMLVVGFGLISHAVNLLLLASAGGRTGPPPLVPVDGRPPPGMVDPLPQALVLTAIVIGFGMGAFLLALALRNVRELGKDDSDRLEEDPL